jgi:hypothetical protein
MIDARRFMRRLAARRHKRRRFDRPAETDAIDDNLTLNQCLERRAVLSAQLSNIGDDIDAVRSQLESAEIEQITTGVPTNTAWKRKRPPTLCVTCTET